MGRRPNELTQSESGPSIWRRTRVIRPLSCGARPAWSGTPPVSSAAGHAPNPIRSRAGTRPTCSRSRCAIHPGHEGSHCFLTHEFIDALKNDRHPTVDVYEALNYTVPGIIAHESSLRGGERLEIPQFTRP